jgi:hypothetical protein
MSRWYRAYEGTVTDPKLSEAAMDAGVSRSVAIAAWHLILGNACSLNDGGRIEVSPHRIAAALCEPLAVIEMLHSSFTALGLISGTHVAAWARRQFESDSSTDRSRAHRAKKKAAAQTGAEKTAETLPPATDATLRDVAATDQSQRHRQKVPEATASGQASPPSLSASDMTKAIFDTGVSILKAAGHDDRPARSIIGRWRKTYSDSIVLSALPRCQSIQPSDPVEWMPRALHVERQRAAGETPQASQRPARPSVRDIGMRLAAEMNQPEEKRIAIGGH